MLEAVGSAGYEETSVRAVLDQSGLYRQFFYDNFADKDACYLAAFEFGVARIEALVLAAAAGEETWRSRLRAGLGALLDFIDSEPGVARALLVEVHVAGGEALVRRAAAMQRLAGFVELAQLEADGREPTPAIAAEGVVSGMFTVIHSRLAAGEDSGFRELMPDLMYFAILPYFGPEAAGEELPGRTGS
jgi:AcrR family transcriptional regulator